MPFAGLVLIMLFGAAAPVAVEAACMSSAAQRARNGKAEPQRCWKEAEDIVNRDSAGRKAPPLPTRFDGAKVERTAVVIKLCIDSSGKVVRTIVLTSSGNETVDTFYRETLSKWTFKPVSKDGIAVPSVATIAVNWNPA